MKRNTKTIVCIALLLIAPSGLIAGPLAGRDAQAFVEDLLWHRQSLTAWFDEANLTSSRRRGIKYQGVDHKILIAYDIDESVKQLARAGRVAYTITIDSLRGDFSRLTVSFDQVGTRNQFYFHGRRCISPFAYLTREWKSIESKYFRFILPDTTLTNAYCIGKLEAFVDRTAGLLALPEDDLRLLRTKKID